MNDINDKLEQLEHRCQKIPATYLRGDAPRTGTTRPQVAYKPMIGRAEDGTQLLWAVRWVAGLNEKGTRRVWKTAYGTTLEQAVDQAIYGSGGYE